MELKLKRVTVRSLLDGDRTSFDDGVLKVNRQEIVDMLMKDQRFSSAAVELALPGESTRILPVKDVVEPRCKLEGPGEVFPGFIGDVETVGEGTTLVLSGAAVVTCGKIVGFQEGIIDMSGRSGLHALFQNPQRGARSRTRRRPGKTRMSPLAGSPA